MAGIFNLFGNSEPTAMQKAKFGSTESLGIFSTRSENLGVQDRLHNAKLNPSSATGTKPKGLSFRSKVDPNVHTPTIDTFNQKKSGYSKQKLNLQGSLCQPAFQQKEKISKIVQEKQRRGLSPCSKSPHFKSSSESVSRADFIFKKPETPREKNVYPEPEILSNDWTEEQNFYQVSPDILKLDDDFCRTFLRQRANQVLPFEDEDLKADLKLISIPDLTLSPRSPNIKDSDDDISDIDLPDMPCSDDEDTF